MRIGNLNLSNGAILAPLAGVSNRPFRVLAVRFGASLTYTEMVSSEGIIRSQRRTLEMMRFNSDEQPLGIQLFGANPESMRQAAEITAKEFAPDLIDINFGCPVRKVVNKNGGAAVLKDLKLTEEIIAATVEGAGEIPVTVKARTGWDASSPVYLELGAIAQKAGARAIALHARSRASGFSGAADWDSIRRLKEAVDIPVIGNGDVRTAEDARRMLDETGCDAVMVGRAAMGNPYIFHEIKHLLDTGDLVDPLSVGQKLEIARRHAVLMAEEYGEERGLIKMRKFLGMYVKGLRGASRIRPLLFHVTSLDEIDRIFKEYLAKLVTIGPDDEKTGMDAGRGKNR